MLISVIVPVFNAERFINKAIESVLHQTYTRLELILVNDGSTDGSEEICRQYATVDKRIKAVSQKNSGPAAARNTGVRHATGSVVFFLDADDFIDRGALQTLIERFDRDQTDLVMGNFCKLDHLGEIAGQSTSFHPDDDEPFSEKYKLLSRAEVRGYVRHFLKHPSNHLISYCWGRLYRLSIIRENLIAFDESMRLFEDFVFNLEYLKHTRETLFVNKPLYTYTMRPNHVSASMAVVNGESLLHDMNVFKVKTGEFLLGAGESSVTEIQARREIGHALTHYVIIFLIRTCRQMTRDNRRTIHNEIGKIISHPLLKSCLKSYTPQKGNSRILPWLMKLGMVELIMLTCRRKAHKRYGKLERD